MIVNEYRLIGDCLHGSAILLLIFNIIRTRSCYSVSGLTVILYTITYFCRYLYPFSFDFFASVYNSVYKIYYLSSSALLLFLIYGLFRNTRDKLHETFPVFGYLISAHLLTWITCYFTEHNNIDQEYFWRFSIYLEMFAIIPQLILIHKQGTIEKIMICYLVMLGSYRAFYVLHWIERYNKQHFMEPISFICGCIQTIIYFYFFVYIYPRVKQCPLIEVIKEKAKQEIEDDVPLIHDIV